MKRNTFMKRLAVTALAATMTLGTVPAAAISTFAADEATEATTAAASEITNVDPESDDANHFKSNLSALTGIGATTTDNAAVIADKIQKALGTGFVVSAASDLSDGETSTEKVLTITVTGKANDGKTYEETYTVTVKVSDTSSVVKTNAQKLADVSKAVKKALDGKKDFKATGEYTNNEIKAIVGEELAKYATPSDLKSHDNKDINYGVSVDNDASTESTDATRGKVVGTVTFYFPASAKDDKDNYKGEDATSVTISFEGKRAFENRTLTDAMFDQLADDEDKTGIWTVQDDTTDEVLTARANAWIAKQQKDAASSWNNVTATVTGLTQVDQQGHTGEAGSAIATLSLTDGTRTLSGDVTLTLKHADSTKLDEFDSAITAKAGAYKTTAIQKKNATAAATEDQVKSGVSKILNDAVASKLSNVALSNDGWTKTSNSDNGVYVYDTTKTGEVNSIIKNLPDQKDNTDGKVTGEQRYIAVVAYTPATTKVEGKAEVTVYSYIPDTEKKAIANLSGEKDEKEDVTKETTFTLTFGTLKKKANTYLRFNAASQTYQYYTTRPDNVVSEDENKDADNTYTIKDLLKTNGNDELQWSSSDEKVVLVDQQGRITLKGTGSAEITVTDVDNANLSATITINSGDRWIFSDVQSSSKYYFNPVYWAVRRGITAGTGDGSTFGVNDKVTRAQFVTWLWVEAGKPAVTKSGKFSDVKDTAYYAKAVDWAVAKGITTGTTDTTFSPNQTVNRAQAVTFLYKAYGQGESYNAKVNFTDVPANAYYYTAVQWAVDDDNQVTAGKTATTFAPKDPVTRAEGVTFLAKAAHYANDSTSYNDGKNVQ